MKKVLIIDDSAEFVESVRQLLEANAYEVVTAGSGGEGLEKAGVENPDLIIVDVMMETWSAGFNVVEKLRENEKTRDIPRIMITALSLESPLAPASPELIGVETILRKPIKPEPFLKSVSRALS